MLVSLKLFAGFPPLGSHGLPDRAPLAKLALTGRVRAARIARIDLSVFPHANKNSRDLRVLILSHRCGRVPCWLRPWPKQHRHEAGSLVFAVSRALDFERSIIRISEERRNRAIEPQLRNPGEVSDFLECEKPRLRVEHVSSPPACSVELPPRTPGRDDPQHDPAFDTGDSRRLTQESLSVVGEAECHDHEDCSELPVREGQSLTQRPKCLDPTPLRVLEDAERRVCADIHPQGFSEPSRSNTDLEPGAREVGAQLPQAEHLRRKERLPPLGVEPRVVARGLAFEYLGPTQITVPFASL